jgi:hypothetical protein
MIIPGRVSTEVDARLSFDKEATKAKVCAMICGWSISDHCDSRLNNSLLSMSLLVYPETVFWSRWLLLGRVFKPLRSWRRKTTFIATSHFFSALAKLLPVLKLASP